MSSKTRARRMARNHKRLRGQARLSLVSLMDIFTILVFFLMVNSGDVEVLEADKNISLPESVSEQKPDIALTIKVSADDVVVQGRSLGRVADILAQPEPTVASLSEELAYQAERAPALSPEQEARGRPVIIMGDQGMPYKLLKRIMSTCAAGGYRDITLAVNTAAPAAEPQLAVLGGQ